MRTPLFLSTVGFTLLLLRLKPIGSRSLEVSTRNLDEPWSSSSSSTTLEESSLGNGSDDEVLWTESDPDPCALLLPSVQTHVVSNPLITISHVLFNASKSVIPGVTYQVNFEMPMGSEFVLEYWFGYFGGLSSPYAVIPPTKKRRHQRDRRESTWLDVSPSNSTSELFPCSKNAFGGMYNESGTSTHIFTFNWFLKTNLYPPTTGSPTVVFRLRFKSITTSKSLIMEQTLSVEVEPECHLVLNLNEGTSVEMTLSTLHNSQAENLGLNCSIMLRPPTGFGLQTRFSNLSVYGIRDLCKGRFIHFNRLNDHKSSSASLEFPLSNDLPEPSELFDYKYCGKIEDYAPDEKVISFTPAQLSTNSSSVGGVVLTISLPGYVKPKETFTLDLTPISPCEKVVLTNLQGRLSYQIASVPSESSCSIVIHVPFGNTISAKLSLLTSLSPTEGSTRSTVTVGPNSIESSESGEENSREFDCILNSRKSIENGPRYFIIRVEEVGVEGHEKHHRIFCLEKSSVDSGNKLEKTWKSLGNRLHVTFTLDANFPGFELSYHTEIVQELRRDCDEGWVHVTSDGGCVLLVEKRLSWSMAEDECQGYGGHLVTVKNSLVQRQVEEIIKRSATFQSRRGYWIGASDRESEGNFQWTSGLPFAFTNWFPGAQRNIGEPLVNSQPNDDGLSEQDCVELRQDFEHPPVYKSTVYGHLSRDVNDKNTTWPERQKLFHWNDRSCPTPNYFLCERTKHSRMDFVCNRTFRVGPIQEAVTVTSPQYPSPYPDNTLCITRLETVPGHRLVVMFDKFHLEDSPNCKYDSLELSEPSAEPEVGNTTLPSKNGNQRLCGDWNRRLKLLRYTSITASLSFKFESDYSHYKQGFSAKVWSEKEVTEECRQQHMQGFRNNCYLVVSSSVNFETAHQFCLSLNGSLASIVTVEEWRFVTQMVTRADYYKKNVYWLGGYIDKFNQLAWKDRMPFNFSAFHPSDLQSISEWRCLSLYWHEGGKGTFAWRLSSCNQLFGYICKKASKVEPRPELNRTFVGIGGKLSSPRFPLKYANNLDYTVQLLAPAGTLVVIQFLHVDIEVQDECLYDYVHVIDHRTKNSSRVCGTFNEKDLERFDFVSTSNTVDIIFHSDFSEVGTGFELIWRVVDVSECLSGKTILTGLGNGFPLQGSFHSPNFPYFNLPELNCVYTIVAPAGHRIWLHFDIFEVGEGNEIESVGNEEPGNSLTVPEPRHSEDSCASHDHVLINLLSDTDSIGYVEETSRMKPSRNIKLCGNLTMFPFRTAVVSSGEKIQIRLNSRKGHCGRGLLGKFKAVSLIVTEQLLTEVEPNATFLLTSLNFPFEPPPDVNLTTAFTSPPSYIIRLEIRGDTSTKCHLKANSYLVIHDPYVGTNGTSWIVCNPSLFAFGRRETGSERDGVSSSIVVAASADSLLKSRSSIHIASTTTFHSTFNRLEVTQVYKSRGSRQSWQAEVVTSLDENFRAKVLSGGDRLLLLNACSPNPCLNGGKCVSEGGRHFCRCPMPFTGPFCGLSVCDFNYCLFGDCVVEENSIKCLCHIGYAGPKCEGKAKPCMREGKEDKCNGHGECIEVNDSTYRCLCHAFWEGPRCDGRMQNLPFRPLSERMLREPFWLGIITVTVVLGVIGLVWCLKRHFPEKLEKFLNDDLDRNRRISWVSARSPSSFRLGGGCSYHGVRDPVQYPSTSQVATSPQAARSFLGRFGIRKPSLLSLSSATSVSAATTSPHTYENRTFSLDDLLRPSRSSMMRTPSPHRRRNFSIHSRRDPMEKQQILQQLVSSGVNVSLDGESKPTTPKPTIAEIIQMSEKRLRLASLALPASSVQEPSSSFSLFIDKVSVENETSFSTVPTPTAASKAEKKVTFARLMDKLTAHEMSSSSSCSDLSCAEELSCTRTIVVNPKPPKKDRKGRFKRSKAYTRGRNSETDQDGFEISSSDTTPDPICPPPRFPTRPCASPTGIGLSVSANNSPNFKPSGKSLTKMASADSLLALFRRFSGSSSAPPSPQYSENEESSAGATPLSTPSSPRNSALSLNIRPPAFLISTPDTFDSSTSPGHDPYANPGGGPGSWRSQAQNMISLEVPMREHCLSPIHEVPTPLPTPSHSPAHSPMIHRPKESEVTPQPQRIPVITLHASSEAEDDDDHAHPGTMLPMVIPKIAISQECDDDCMLMLNDDEDNNRRWTETMIPDVLIHSSSESSHQPSPRFTFDDKEISRSGFGSPGRSKGRPPPLVFANEIMTETKARPFSALRDEHDEGNDSRVPVVIIQDPTPVSTPLIEEDARGFTSNGSKSVSVPPDITAFAVTVSSKPWEIHPKLIHTNVQAHPPLIPPMILLNQNSEPESDSDVTIRKIVRKPNLSFLSPFVGTSDRVPSESNLSTSGYSSMASPCPSRCPSVSPLCPDMEDYHTGHHNPFRRSSLVTPGSSRKSSLTLTPRRCSLNATSPLVSFASNLLGMDPARRSSPFGESSELIEIETDSALELETDPETKLPKKVDDLTTCQDFLSLSHLLQIPRKNMLKSHSLDMDVPEHDTATTTTKKGHAVLQSELHVSGRPRQSMTKGDSLDSKLNKVSPVHFLPAVFSGLHKALARSKCGLDDTKRLSPVSSRSDSSMSELSVIGLVGGFASPITDSDAVYDCASSEVGTSRPTKKTYANTFYLSPSQQIRRSGRRKNRKRQSFPQKKLGPGTVAEPEEVKGQEMVTLPLRPAVTSTWLPLNKNIPSSTSPKRRVRAQTNLDVTSSSSESLNSLRSSRSRVNSPVASPKQEKNDKRLLDQGTTSNASVLLEGENITALPTTTCKETTKRNRDWNTSQVLHSRHRNISRSRLRTISLQIRFLRRLERNLVRKREKLNSTQSHVKQQQGKGDQRDRSSSSRSCSTCSGSDTSTSFSTTSSSSSSSEDGEN